MIHNIWKKQKLVLPTALAWFVTMAFVHFAWIFFRAPDLSSATKIIGRMFTSIKTSSIPVQYHVEGFLLLGTFLLLLYNSMEIKDFLLKRIESSKIVQFFTLMVISILTVLCIVVFCSIQTKPSPFLYFQF